MGEPMHSTVVRGRPLRKGWIASVVGVALTLSMADIGNKLDFIKANIHFGLLRDDIAPALRSYLQSLVAAG